MGAEIDGEIGENFSAGKTSFRVYGTPRPTQKTSDKINIKFVVWIATF